MTTKTPVQEAYEELAVVLWPRMPPGTLAGAALAKYEAAIRADERVLARRLVEAVGPALEYFEVTLYPCDNDCECILHPLRSAFDEFEQVGAAS